MRKLIAETINNCIEQDYPNIEIIVYDDCSTDNTDTLFQMCGSQWKTKYYRGYENKGVGEAFNEGIKKATGDIIILFCADDLWTDKQCVSDIVKAFDDHPYVGYVTRYYYQFIHGYPGPVRAWRGNNPIVLANNPSGLAFRRQALIDAKASCSNKMFVETTKLASDVIKSDWRWHIIPWDMVAVRVHRSTSTQRSYWLKRRVSSPVLDQTGLGATDIATDFVSLIQIKRGFTLAAVWEEICNFVKVRPWNLVNPRFWFWSIVSLVIPRSLAVGLPEFYRHRIGRILTREIRRANV
jgi:glycosyltransferase involved in cell wall biosynthesis